MDRCATAFCSYAADKLEQNLRQIERCVAFLDTAELWARANERCNSVGNLVLHLAGNIQEWVLGGLAGASVHRDRAAEFAARGPIAPEEVLPPLQRVIRLATDHVRRLDSADLARDFLIQEYRVAGIVAVTHVVEHFSFHTGQIVHITKELKGVDLSLYDAAGHKLLGGNVVP